MIPAAPRRTVSTPAPPQSWSDFDDDDGWQGGCSSSQVTIVLIDRHACRSFRQDANGLG